MLTIDSMVLVLAFEVVTVLSLALALAAARLGLKLHCRWSAHSREQEEAALLAMPPSSHS